MPPFKYVTHITLSNIDVNLISSNLVAVILSYCVCVCLLCQLQLFVTPWIVACQAPLSMGLSQQK